MNFVHFIPNNRAPEVLPQPFRPHGARNPNGLRAHRGLDNVLVLSIRGQAARLPRGRVFGGGAASDEGGQDAVSREGRAGQAGSTWLLRQALLGGGEPKGHIRVPVRRQSSHVYGGLQEVPGPHQGM